MDSTVADMVPAEGHVLRGSVGFLVVRGGGVVELVEVSDDKPEVWQTMTCGGSEMKRWVVARVVAVLMLGAMGLVTSADTTSSILEPISPMDEYQPNTGVRPVIVTDSSGAMMVVFKAKNPADNKWQLCSLLRSGSATDLMALPKGDIASNTFTSLEPTGLVSGPGSEEYHLVAGYGARLYYWHYESGTWSSPVQIPSANASSGMVMSSGGQPIVVYLDDGSFHYVVPQGGGWQEVAVGGPGLSYGNAPPVYLDSSGLPHMLGKQNELGVVASLAAGANALQAGSWTLSPTGDAETWTSPAPQGGVQYVLDPPNQRVCAAWVDDKTINVAWSPLGATSEGQWQTHSIPPDAGVTTARCRLISNGRGAVGLMYYWYPTDGQRKVYFRWVSSSALGDAVELTRPPAETEAANFTDVGTDTLSAFIDEQGTAHAVAVAKKPGEETGNVRRIYYAAIGGGPATSGSDVVEQPGGDQPTQPETPGGTQPTETAAKPDFYPLIIDPQPGERIRLGTTLRPRFEIHNIGASYYGRTDDTDAEDLRLRAYTSGVVATIKLYDTSGHQTPLFSTDQTRGYYLPRLDFLLNPDPENPWYNGQAMPETEYSHYHPQASHSSGPGNQKFDVITGLGRKSIQISIRTAGICDDANTDNNGARVSFVAVDGRRTKDRMQIDGTTVRGLNDVAVFGTPLLQPNTPLLRPGYVQRPATLQVLVGNPRLAGVFTLVPVSVTLDEQEVGFRCATWLTRNPNIFSSNLLHFNIPGESDNRADLSAKVLDFPLDLTDVSPGQHQLKVVVDPQDTLGDLVPENNQATLNINVRPPGGTVKVKVVDQAAPTVGLPDVPVYLKDWYWERTDEQGWVEIADVPAGTYQKEDIGTNRTTRRVGDEHVHYIRQNPEAGFTLSEGQTHELTIKLQKPVTISGRVHGNPQHSEESLITDDAVHVGIKERWSQNVGTSPGYKLLDVLPEPQTLTAWAYSYIPLEQAFDVSQMAPNPGGSYQVNLTLQPGPQATIAGRVTRQGSTTGLNGAKVWLTGAPRSTKTDTQGYYTIAQVAADRDCQLMVMRGGYALAAQPITDLSDGETRVVNVPLAKVSSHKKERYFDATARVQVEVVPSIAAGPSYQVTVRHGIFRVHLGLHYHTVNGQDTVDDMVIGIQQGPAFNSAASSSWNPGSVIAQGLSEFYGKAVGAGFSIGLGVLNQANPIQRVQKYMQGTVDPNELHDGGTVGTYVSWSGTDYSSVYSSGPGLFDLAQGNLPIAGQWAGGWTRVRMDRVELSDGQNGEKVVWKQWWSPKAGIYPINAPFNIDDLVVKIYVKVHNQDRVPIWGCAKNIITWQPKTGDLMMVADPAYAETPYSN